MILWLVTVAVAFLAGCAKPPETARYVDSRSCTACHAAIAKSYQQTAMAQAFHAVRRGNREGVPPLGRYVHPASGRTYEITERAGRYFQSRTEAGENSMEREIHYVMGSGRHVKTLIHRTAQGRLIELPLAWYAENGGFLAMSPGYDKTNPLDFRRKISFDCMFCHNAYPAVPEGQDRPAAEPVFPAELPEGIDCQRCHGPGSLHIASGGRGGIVNPAKLPPDRAMEVCMQCHLETTSRPLPNSLVRFDRGAFSYRPGEPLGEFMLHFDHAPGTGREGKFEIVSSVYRLRQSRCFQESAGKMGCTTCHNPHDVPRGTLASAAYRTACRSCHGNLSGGPHTEGADCAGCHMPKRRTEDVVHAVMTDHKITRKIPAGYLLSAKAETHETRFNGEVVLYYPPRARESELYLAVAQVAQKSNVAGGIRQLEALSPKSPQAAFALGEAYEATGNRERATSWYQKALERDPAYVAAMLRLGGIPMLERARSIAPQNPGVHYALGLAFREAGRTQDAVTALETAVQYDPDLPEVHNALGGVYFETGNRAKAEKSLREALRLQPDFAEAHLNLGQFLLATDGAAAEKHLRAALRWNPAEMAGWRSLGALQSSKGAWVDARRSFQEALRLRPDDQEALLGLGTAQAALGDVRGARENLKKASGGRNAELRTEALALLRELQ